MKRNIIVSLTVLLALAAMPGKLRAQGFSSGSDGSFGPLTVTSNTTIALPPSGILNCTTITINTGFTLRFTRNALNTPVHLLATGDVLINGIIDVSGRAGSSSPPVGGEGGPGGFDGGKPGTASVPPGAGYGPGGARGGENNTAIGGAGTGAYATVGTGGNTTNRGTIYGSPLLVPLVGGSGGGGSIGTPGIGGGGAGGGILIASSTRIEMPSGGRISARGGGGGGAYNGGSGGGVRLVAPVISGNGNISVGSDNGGGNGRIRVDTLNRTGLAFSFDPTSSTSVGSMMFVFPSPNPRLDILQAADTQIPEGSGPVFVQLPFGSSPNRTVTVQARDFNAVVPLQLVLTPDNGVPQIYTAQIDNRAVNPAQTTVNVVLPVNVQVTINAWNRSP